MLILTFLQPAKRPAAVASSSPSRPIKEAIPEVKTEPIPQAKPVSSLIFHSDTFILNF